MLRQAAKNASELQGSSTVCIVLIDALQVCKILGQSTAISAIPSVQQPWLDSERYNSPASLDPLDLQGLYIQGP